MKRALVIVFGILVPAILIYIVYLGYNVVFEPNVNPEKLPYELYVEEGTTVEEVYAKLLEDEVLLHPDGFLFLAENKGLTTIKSGHYVINEVISNNSLINILMGGLQKPISITFTGAENLADLAGKLGEQLLVDSADLYNELNAQKEGWEGPLALGAFLPDTYEVYWNASAESIAKKLHQNTIAFWTPARIKQAEALKMTPAEISTLASIVMKESSKATDRPLVARLYLNRLQKGMKLQADPTVIFAMNDLNPDEPVRRVLTRDLKLEHPYNTYVIKGLPPGPICVPEKAALLAVLEAPKHDYLFMCADPEKPGYHAFSVSYSGHLANQRRWTQWLDAQKIYR
jgi:UPF0755 protein